MDKSEGSWDYRSRLGNVGFPSAESDATVSVAATQALHQREQGMKPRVRSGGMDWPGAGAWLPSKGRS